MGRVKLVILYIFVIVVILLPDVLLDMLHSIFELVMHLGHTAFEILEVSLDLVVEHAFDTELHQTQIIVFYILFIMFLLWLWRLWRAWPRYYQNKKNKFRDARAQKKAAIYDYWSESLLNKIIVISSIGFLLSLIFLFAF